MNKKAVGILLGAAAGFGSVLWFLRKTGRVVRTKNVDVLLKKNDVTGKCEVASVDPEIVTLSKLLGDKVTWWIENPEASGCDDAEVCIDRWKKDKVDTDPPVEFENGEKCKSVPRGHRRPIKAKVRHTDKGDYKYSIEIKGGETLDPIVRIVL